MTIKSLYPNVRPTLNLNFARTKALDPRITFTRASTATFVGSDGLIQTAASGAARFDHNPATGESLGLLVEEARTNYALYSQQVGDWTLSNVTATGNSIVAPDGTTTATLLTDNSATSTHSINRTFTNNQSTTTFSVYVKRGAARYFAIGGASTSPEASACFDFDNPTTITYQAGSITNFSSASLTVVANGWYRVVATHAGFGGSGTGTVYLFTLNSQPANSGGMSGFSPLSYTGSSSLSIYWWGFQIEQAAFPTSYIPTTTATVTRAADVASMTGTNFSSWYNQSQGTLFGSFKTSTTDGNMGLFAAYQASAATTNRISLRPRNSFADTAGTQQFFFNSVSVSTGQQAKMAWGFGSTATLYKDGTLIGTDSSVTLSSVLDAAIIGNYEPGSTGWTNGTIARLAYYPVRLPDAQLQALTS